MFWGHTCTCTTMTEKRWCSEGTFALVTLCHRKDDVLRAQLHLYHYDTEEMMFWGHIFTCTTMTQKRWCSDSTFALVTLWHRKYDVLRAQLHLYHYDTEEMMFWGHIFTCTTMTQKRWCSEGTIALVTLWHRRDDVLRAAHLGKHLVEPLKGAVQVHLNKGNCYTTRMYGSLCRLSSSPGDGFFF